MAHRGTRAALAGLAGFGLGGALPGALGDAMLLGFALAGAVGGAAVALALDRAWWKGALAGLLGFGIGTTLAFFVVLALWDPPFSMAFVGLVSGAIGGAALGAAVVKPRGKALVAGALVGGAAFAAAFALVFETGLAPEFETCCGPAQRAALALATAVVLGPPGAALAAALAATLFPRARNGRA